MLTHIDPQRLFVLLAALLGFTGVGAGAFGAHALKTRLADNLMAAYQTGVLYHLLHAVALLAVAALVGQASPGSQAWAVRAGYLFALGVLVFSGSLYALALTNIRVLGAITPIGGVAMMAGWACLMAAAAIRA